MYYHYRVEYNYWMKDNDEWISYPDYEYFVTKEEAQEFENSIKNSDEYDGSRIVFLTEPVRG